MWHEYCLYMQLSCQVASYARIVPRVGRGGRPPGSGRRLRWIPPTSCNNFFIKFFPCRYTSCTTPINFVVTWHDIWHRATSILRRMSGLMSAWIRCPLCYLNVDKVPFMAQNPVFGEIWHTESTAFWYFRWVSSFAYIPQCHRSRTCVK